MQSGFVEKLPAIVGAPNVLTGIDLSPYVVEGRTPAAAVFPGSVDEVRAVVTLAAEAGVPLIPWGGGTAATVGIPPAHTGVVLGLRRLARIVEHEPGDLTVTAEAGITLAELQAALRAKRQWLSLDPPEAARATVGGIVAANAAGPRRHLYGTARDLLIGITVITGDGSLVRGGGKVVKNVAGYDVPKLFVGSYGTLGIIVAATLKLRPVAEDERLVATRFDRIKDAAAAVRALLAGDLVPNAVVLLDGEASRAVGMTDGAPTLVVGFDGLTEQVEWQSTQTRDLGASFGGRATAALAPAAWSALADAARAAAATPAAVMRFSVLPTLVGETMEQGAGAGRQRGLHTAWAADAGVGGVTAAVFSGEGHQDPAALAALLGEWREMAHAGGGHATLEWAPLAVKELVPVWDDLGAAARIMRGIKLQLDPRQILNPGRFAGGI